MQTSFTSRLFSGKLLWKGCMAAHIPLDFCEAPTRVPFEMQKPRGRAIEEQAIANPLVGRRQEDECIIAVVRQDVLLLRLPVDVEF